MEKTKEANLLKVLIEQSDIEKQTLLIEGFFSNLLFENSYENKNIFTDGLIFSVYKFTYLIQFEINIRDIKQVNVEVQEEEKIKKVLITTPNLDFFEIVFKYLKKLKPVKYKIYNKKDIESYLLNLL